MLGCLSLSLRQISVAFLVMFGLPMGLMAAAGFCCFVGCVFLLTRRTAERRRADIFTSFKFELDDESIQRRSNFGSKIVSRFNIAEAWFSRRGIWIRPKKSRNSLRFPPELAGFDELVPYLKNWLPADVVLHDSPPSSDWTTVVVYLVWIAASVTLGAALASRTRSVAVPCCLIAGVLQGMPPVDVVALALVVVPKTCD